MTGMTEDREWVKSSLSFANGNCVEVAWARSSLSHANGQCVETLPQEDGGVWVRNSRDPEGGVLKFTAGEWEAFIGGCKLGEFDRFGQESRKDASVPFASQHQGESEL